MSRSVRFESGRLLGGVLCAGWLALPAAQAQTIADYSRVQRALLESAMTQAAARSAASAPGAAAPTLPSAPVQRVSPVAATPEVRVSGVFATAANAMAEVAVDDTAYLLVAGQGVPGTAWRVESVAVDRVVITRREADVGAGPSQPLRRVFALPVLR